MNTFFENTARAEYHYQGNCSQIPANNREWDDGRGALHETENGKLGRLSHPRLQVGIQGAEIISISLSIQRRTPPVTVRHPGHL